MFNPFAFYKDNPGPEENIIDHESLWRAVTKIRIRQAISDTRIVYNTWAIGLLVALHVATLGLIVAVLV